ncbi:MAG: HipA domain-containing protein [Deltaproteobacteria bacterium]|nr:HipA domain-containing protein [Deltaproteobacteria bacterium]
MTKQMSEKEIKAMFGINRLPVINFSLQEIAQKAQEMVNQLSISGVQPKLSVALQKKTGELIATAQGGEYILKPQIGAFPHLPENENCCMNSAEDFSIEVPKHCLLSLKDGSWAYLVKRFDREKDKKIHQEDFTQILSKSDKYSGSFEEIGKTLKKISSVPGLDVQLFFERIVFNFLIGNGDAHHKNFSIRYLEDGEIRLSPAYDLVCSKLVIPREEDLALNLNGKRNKMRKRDFDVFADYLEIPEKVRYEKFIGQAEKMIAHIHDSFLTDQEKEQFEKIVRVRWAILGG